MKKVSVVITILNEETTIASLLRSLKAQSKKPDEVIIIDAGSTDGTVNIVREFQRKSGMIRLLVKPGANRSLGRNIGIARAHGPIIALIDAGCAAKRDWLKKLTRPFKDPEVDVVAGFYKPKGDSIVQRCLAVYTCVLPHQMNTRTFLPASRSMAFRKFVWKEVGGFPEALNTCEDRVFVDRLKQQGALFVLAKDAVVSWEQQRTVKNAFRQLFGYARGDMEAGYTPHVRKIVIVWIRYFVGIYVLLRFPLLLLLIIPQYLAWVIGKGYAFVKDRRALLWLPLLQLTADAAVMSGSLVGLINRRRSHMRNRASTETI